MITWVRLATYGAVLLGLIGFGWYLGSDHVQVKWDKERVAIAAVVAKQQADNLAKELTYERQLSAAADQHGKDLADLARIRAVPVHGIVCHNATSGGALPGVPAPAAGKPASGGELQDGVDFDPTKRLYAEADRADDTVELCRDALSKWPHQ